MPGKARAKTVSQCPFCHGFLLFFHLQFASSLSFIFHPAAAAGAGDLPPSLAAPVMATPLAPPAQPLSPLAPLAAPAAAQAPVVELPLQTPGSAVQLQEAAQLRGGRCGTNVTKWSTKWHKCGTKSDTQVIQMYSISDNEKEWTCLCQSLDMSDMWSSVICLPASLQRGKCHLPVLSRRTVQVLRFSVESGFNHEVNKQYDREQKPWTGFPWTGCEHWTLSLFWRSNALKNDGLVGSWVLTSCQSCQGPVPMVPWYSGIGGDAPVLAKAGVWSSLWSFSADLNLPVFGSNSDARMPAPDAFSFENRRPIAFTKLPSHQRSLSLTWAGPYEHQAEVEKVRKLRDEFEGASAECLDKLERGRARAQAMRSDCCRWVHFHCKGCSKMF